MKGAKQQDPQNKKIQRSLKELDTVAAPHHWLWSHTTQ
jgi:hypothetical protein